MVDHKAEGEAYLAENAKRPEVTITPSGLQYEIIKEGDGAKPAATDTVEVNYHGTFINNKVFDSTYTRGSTIEFPLNGVIAGWTEGLQLMPVGSTYKFAVPYNLAYGEQGHPAGIPGYATLLFEVELVDIK
jgi:FKBP-type peptidyl-prolyl cis-trans isomerase FklB